MRHPQVTLCTPNDRLSFQLREITADRRWAFREVKQTSAWVHAAAERRPGVAVIQVDFAADEPRALAAVTELHRRNPDTDVVVVSDTKLNDDDRPAWTANILDLGVRVVLFPPVTRAVLEDAVNGLLDARIRRCGVTPVSPTPPAIDLAAGGYEAVE